MNEVGVCVAHRHTGIFIFINNMLFNLSFFNDNLVAGKFRRLVENPLSTTDELHNITRNVSIMSEILGRKLTCECIKMAFHRNYRR